MKTKISPVLGLLAILAMFTSGCGAPRVGRAETTLDAMPGVEKHLTYAKRTTTVTGDGPPTITLVEESRSKGQAQFELRGKELDGNTASAVSYNNRPQTTYIPGGYGYGVGGYPTTESYYTQGGPSGITTSPGNGPGFSYLVTTSAGGNSGGGPPAGGAGFNHIVTSSQGGNSSGGPPAGGSGFSHIVTTSNGGNAR